MKKALILNYHLIDGKSYSFDSFGGIYAVKLDDFERQMEVLEECNVKVASLNDIIDNKVNDDFCVALTFDDGNPSDYDLVYPILKQHRYEATFFLSLRNLEFNGVLWEHYREMNKNGFGIGSHGLTHRDLSSLEPSEVRLEFEQSKLIIESNISYPVRFFSLPFGMYNSKVIKLAKETGYDAILTTRFKYVNSALKSYVIGRWSIKRKTSIEDFSNIIQNHRLTVNRYKYASTIKKRFSKGLGSTMTNKIHAFKNKYF